MATYSKNILKHLQDLMLRVEILEEDNAEKDIRISGLEAENKKLILEIERLRNILNKDSSNSSKPPSTDGFKKIFNSREKSGKKSGGQLGHKGYSRKLFNNPTQIIEHKQKFCDCGHEILYKDDFVAKQHVDIELKANIVEHRAFKGRCPCCKKKYKNTLPFDLINPVTYGNNVKAFVMLLSAEGCVSLNRIQSFLAETSDGVIKVSDGTIVNWQKEFASKTDEEIAEIKKNLISSKALHKDESVVYVENNLQWFHTLGNKDVTLYHVNAKRGHEADIAMGILPIYKGVLVRDHFAALVNLTCEQQECNAHVLRYLKAEDAKGKAWAKEMIEVLVLAHRETRGKGQKISLPPERVSYYEREYDRIIDAGMTEHESSTERLFNTDNIKLLRRMQKYKTAHLLFLSRAEVPFDNNLAERDLRMIKTKTKVSGCFRSEKGAENFAKAKSVLSTARKQHQNLFRKTHSLFSGV